MLSQSLSVGGLQSNTPSLAALHSNSCGSPNNFSNLSTRELSNSTESSLKVAKSGKPTNRWSGLWGSSSKVCDQNKLTPLKHILALPTCGLRCIFAELQPFRISNCTNMFLPPDMKGNKTLEATIQVHFAIPSKDLLCLLLWDLKVYHEVDSMSYL